MQKQVYEIALQAGEAILKHYGNHGTVINKDDNTPLTRADNDAHECISRKLKAFTPDIPVLSEEGDESDYKYRNDWETFWLVDPLDGTKEFIKASGEFTVNIALVKKNRPVLGVIHCPVKGYTYVAEAEKGAWFIVDSFSEATPINTRMAPAEHIRIVASRDHKGPQVQQIVDNAPKAELTSIGSSLKFCLVAHGKADVYLRDTPTMEWDTGAAQIIVEEAGGKLLTLEGKPLFYNKEVLKNPAVIALGDETLPWQQWLSKNAV